MTCRLSPTHSFPWPGSVLLLALDGVDESFALEDGQAGASTGYLTCLPAFQLAIIPLKPI